jgi:hypothetical protein
LLAHDSAGGELASKTEPGVDGDETPARALAGPPIVGATGSVESVHLDPNAIGEDGAWSSGGRSRRRRRHFRVPQFEQSAAGALAARVPSRAAATMSGDEW